MFALPGSLRQAGVLGINRRNADYMLPYNPRRYYPLVDDKYLTKQLAIANDIAIPELYQTIKIERQIRDLPLQLQQHASFVVKPARGSGGDGIVVIDGQYNGHYRKASGLMLEVHQLQHHVSNILSGMYSLGGQSDKCLIEYRVQFDPVFANISYLGVPDIRIVVFLGVPVMAMIRLPTRASDGKANLHQGAIGAGIDMFSGQTTNAVWKNTIVGEHPDTGNPLTAIQVPHWDSMLTIAAQCYHLTGLGYLGIDLVLDRDKGPLLLEMNARPGLNIQLANAQGLLTRLEAVKRHHHELQSPEQRLRFAKEQFSR